MFYSMTVCINSMAFGQPAWADVTTVAKACARSSCNQTVGTANILCRSLMHGSNIHAIVSAVEQGYTGTEGPHSN